MSEKMEETGPKTAAFTIKGRLSSAQPTERALKNP